MRVLRPAETTPITYEAALTVAGESCGGEECKDYTTVLNNELGAIKNEYCIDGKAALKAGAGVRLYADLRFTCERQRPDEPCRAACTAKILSLASPYL